MLLLLIRSWGIDMLFHHINLFVVKNGVAQVTSVPADLTELLVNIIGVSLSEPTLIVTTSHATGNVCIYLSIWHAGEFDHPMFPRTRLFNQ